MSALDRHRKAYRQALEGLTEIVGAESSVTSGPVVFSKADFDAAAQKIKADKADKATKAKNAGLIFLGGFVVSAIGGAALWKEHRGLGALLGGVLAGPIVGGTGVLAYAAHIAKKEGVVT